MAALALGLALSPAGGVAVIAAAVAAALPLCAAAGLRERREDASEHPADSPVGGLAALGALAGLLVLAGGLVGQARLSAIDGPADRVQDGDSLSGVVVALGRPRPGTFGASLDAEPAGGRLRGARLLVRIPRWGHWPREASSGDLVSVRGRLRRLAATGRSAPYAAYLRRRGVAAELLLASARATGERRHGLSGAIDGMRRRSERAIEAGLPREDAELLRGMVLGEDEAIAESVRDSFRASGLAHLLAVSGQNVMLLAALALPALALAGLGIRARCAALLALIAIYVPLAGAGPSLQRAGVMGAAGVVALASSRPASRTYALLLAAAVTLGLNPRAAGDPAWQLSFAAVAGIVWLVPPLQSLFRKAVDAAAPRPRATTPLGGAARASGGRGLRRRALEGLADGAALTLVATLATAPLLAHHFGYAPLAGLPANLLALPAVAPAMWAGMLDATIGQAAALGQPFAGASEALAKLLGALGRPPVAYIAWLADRFAELPGGRLELPLRSPFALTSAYVALGACVAGLRALARPLGPRAEATLATWRRLPGSTQVAVASLGLAAAALAVTQALAPPAAPGELTVRFLDVGQGDATLIQDGAGASVLFDGGPPEGGVFRELRAAGVRRLDMVVSTHQSRDHQGGLHEVIDRIPTGFLLENGYGTRDPDYHRLLAEADARGIRRVPARAGQLFHVGRLSIKLLGPLPRAPGEPPPEDPNPIGVAVIVSEGSFDLWLSADAESDAILQYPLRPVEAMKVSHHGSRDLGLPEVLAKLRPQVAAIEVGAGNSYGHPTPETLGALHAAVPHVYRTDRDGTVSLTAGRDGLAVASSR